MARFDGGTRNGGAFVSYHLYHPYGAEATAFNQDTERKKFTGHERDLGSTSSAADDLDYMHDRYFNPTTGRFMAVDRLRSWEPWSPRSWNRYAYALSNPIRYVDPDGLKEQTGWKAGAITNHSDVVIWIAADLQLDGRPQTVAIPLDPGETSTDFMTDADALIVAPGQTISRETSGAYKVGPGDVGRDGGFGG